MRTIKFRGKRVDNGEWVYGSLINNMWTYSELSNYPKGTPVCEIFTGKYDASCWEDAINEDELYFEVHHETVGQFTGLLDKDGKEIYEGDVLKMHKVHHDWINDLYCVFFKDGSFHVKTPKVVGRYTLSKHIEEAYKEDLIDSFDDYSVLFEVVGNIHDNPELI